MTAPNAERIREIRDDDANGFGCGRSHDLLAALDHVAERLTEIDTGDDASCDCGLCTEINHLIAYIEGKP